MSSQEFVDAAAIADHLLKQERVADTLPCAAHAMYVFATRLFEQKYGLSIHEFSSNYVSPVQLLAA